MIGQQKVLSKIDRLINYHFPRFTIITGPAGSGKKLLATQIAKKLNATAIFSGIKVDNIREVIKLAYKQAQPVVYILPDADSMSINAKNALLKVTEEPPRQAYFIITVQDLSNTLQTLISRGTVFKMAPYSGDELAEYVEVKHYPFSEREKNIIYDVCRVPGDIDIMANYKIQEFYEFVKTVAENVTQVNGSNALKITKQLKYKEDDAGKYPVDLFLGVLIRVYLEYMQKQPLLKWLDNMRLVSTARRELQITGISKQAVIDKLILDLREVEFEQEMNEH